MDGEDAAPAGQIWQIHPHIAVEPAWPARDQLAGDRTFDAWQIDPDRLAYALVIKNSATAIREQFGGGTAGAMRVRDYALLLKQRIKYWRRLKTQEVRA